MRSLTIFEAPRGTAHASPIRMNHPGGPFVRGPMPSYGVAPVRMPPPRKSGHGWLFVLFGAIVLVGVLGAGGLAAWMHYGSGLGLGLAPATSHSAAGGAPPRSPSTAVPTAGANKGIEPATFDRNPFVD